MGVVSKYSTGHAAREEGAQMVQRKGLPGFVLYPGNGGIDDEQLVTRKRMLSGTKPGCVLFCISCKPSVPDNKLP